MTSTSDNIGQPMTTD